MTSISIQLPGGNAPLSTEGYRNNIADFEIKVVEVDGDIAAADENIADLEAKLKGFRRYRAYQEIRRNAYLSRITSERAMLRATEDYQSNAD